MEEEIILNKIVEDAENEATCIINEANIKAEKISRNYKEKESKDSQKQFEIIKDLIVRENVSKIEKEELIARNASLVAKKQAIEIVKEKVKQKIRDLSEEEYSKVIENLFNKLPVKENVEVILPFKCYDRISKLAKSFNLTVLSKTDEFDLGFIARDGKIEYNYDFEENMEFNEEEIEKQIDAILFN